MKIDLFKAVCVSGIAAFGVVIASGIYEMVSSHCLRKKQVEFLETSMNIMEESE